MKHLTKKAWTCLLAAVLLLAGCAGRPEASAARPTDAPTQGDAGSSRLTVTALSQRSAEGAEPQPAVAWLMDPATPPAAVAAIALAAIVLAPLAEEILYRAMLFGGLAAQGRPVRAALLSSLFFAALHLSVAAVLPLFALALLFCALWRRWGLAASFGAHAGFNAANVAIAALLMR